MARVLFLFAVVIAATMLLLGVGPALAQQGPPGCAWNKYLYAQDASRQGKIDLTCLIR